MTSEAQRRSPEQPRRPPVRMEAARRVLHLERFAPYYLTLLSATLSARSSATYRTEFGVGVSDWRVIAILAQQPGASATRIVSAVALDKAAVSRSLSGLGARRLVESVAQRSDPRRKRWFLTEAGWTLHDAMLARTLEQEARLTRGIAPGELDACLSVLSRMLDNIAPEREADGPE